MQMPHHSNRIRFNPIERWNKYQTGILFQVHSHHINLYSPNKSDSIRSSANPILEPVLNSDLVCDLREELAARTTRRRRLMRSSVRPSYLNTILRRLSERFVRRHMVVLVELVVLLVSPDHPPKRAKATKMKQQHLCANCVTRKGGKWARGSGERIRSNDGHASVVAAAAVFLLFYGSLFATLGGWGKGLKTRGKWPAENGKSCLCSCLSISSRCSCSPKLQPGALFLLTMHHPPAPLSLAYKSQNSEHWTSSLGNQFSILSFPLAGAYYKFDPERV